MSDRMKDLMLAMKDKGNTQHMLFYGDTGLGKTSLAISLVKEIGARFLFINGSSERKLDVVRDNIEKFLSTGTIGYETQLKYVIIDEIDGMTSDAQNALKATIEMNENNSRFIFTTNHIDKVISPLQGRLEPYDFTPDQSEKIPLAKRMVSKLYEILDLENITYSKKDVGELVKAFFPNFRKTIVMAEKCSLTGTFVKDFTTNIEQMNEIINAMKKDDFIKMRSLTSSVSDYDTTLLRMFKMMETYIEPSSYRVFTLHSSKYLFQSRTTVSKEANFIGLLVELARDCKFR